jgi:hypothetical protein
MRWKRWRVLIWAGYTRALRRMSYVGERAIVTTSQTQTEALEYQ